ncbi:MAG: UDP-N-acetylglucosamine 2-epimerase (non-hydrolyzing) [Ignavibacteriae bacterium]|nr:UDP-N-acetylglucosamine 2-epimerase (non-hydrolyzing) [Ignavibacteriota bacterium]MCB9215106.1 UDP-N-acetylglucosamine 2-epimerase (non-hydrolyzing) [Ignavibacteria bacterium]
MSNPVQKVLLVFGTRPEAIKLAPVVLALRERPEKFATTVVTTGQHRHLVTPILQFFGITPDADLDIMREGQSPADAVVRTIERLTPILTEENFDRLIVQGDTSSAVGAALAGFYAKVPVAHVEAGLRSGRVDDPFPEEMNRQLISRLANLHFAPTEGNRESLLREGVTGETIHVTGNTVIDALYNIVERTQNRELPEALKGLEEKKVMLLTTHRRENIGERQRRIFEGINRLLREHEELAVVFPVHPNPNVRSAVTEILHPGERLRLLDPLDYIPFVQLMKHAWLILTDSGGVQEEAPALGTPVLVLRETTEREEAIASGNALLVGTSMERGVEAVETLLRDEEMYRRMATPAYPFGEGGVAKSIVQILENAW